MEERYSYIKDIGQGGFASVELVWDRRLEKYWALKRMPVSGNESRFKDEIAALMSLRCEGIPLLSDVIYSENEYCLIMDYMKGVSLKRMIETEGAPDTAKCGEIAIEILKLLQVLHTRTPQLIHGDIKPENISIEGNKVALLDFGSIFKVGSLREGFDFSPGYTAPETINQGIRDVRCDIYSVGKVLFFLLTGVRCDGKIYPPSQHRPELSAAWDNLVMKMCSDNPLERPDTADNASEMIKQAIELGNKKKNIFCMLKRRKQAETVRIESFLLTDARFGDVVF